MRLWKAEILHSPLNNIIALDPLEFPFLGVAAVYPCCLHLCPRTLGLQWAQSLHVSPSPATAELGCSRHFQVIQLIKLQQSIANGR